MGAQADTESSEVAAAAVPGLALDTVLPGLAPIPVASVPVPGVVAQAVAMPPQGPLASRLDAAAIVQQVTRALAVRDLEALDAGREVVLRLDETLLPQTVLSFKPMSVAVPGAGVGTDGAAATPQVLVSLETRSDEVRAFLDTHGETLIAAMAREAPGLHWVRGAANSWLDRSAAVPVEPALTLAQATTGDSTPPVLAAGSTSASNSQGGASRERDAEPGLQGDRGGSGTQDRGSSSGSSAGQGQGRDDNPPAAVAGALDDAARARARAAESWSGLSEAARQQAARAFTDAVDGRA